MCVPVAVAIPLDKVGVGRFMPIPVVFSSRSEHECRGGSHTRRCDVASHRCTPPSPWVRRRGDGKGPRQWYSSLPVALIITVAPPLGAYLSRRIPTPSLSPGQSRRPPALVPGCLSMKPCLSPDVGRRLVAPVYTSVIAHPSSVTGGVMRRSGSSPRFLFYCP